MPYTPKYVSVSKVAQILQIDVSPSDVQEDVLDVIELAEYAADSYTGNDFALSGADVSKLFSGLGHDMLTLCPVINTLQTVELLDADSVVIDELTDVVAMPLNPRGGFYSYLLRRNGSVFPRGLANVKVTGTWGFTTVPPDFKLAVSLIAQAVFNARLVNSFTRFEMNAERQVYQVGAKELTVIPEHARELLDKYRIHNIALSE